jgi:hypothetical protein
VKANIVMFLIFFNLSGCVVGHSDYKRYLDMNIGKNIKHYMPYDGSKSGQLIRSDYLLGGDGLTHKTILDDGVVRYHFSGQEVLPNYSIKDYVGRCLVYYDVDPETHIILRWGFDKGGNPLSCRTWP